jgi:hypothetical protein
MERNWSHELLELRLAKGRRSWLLGCRRGRLLGLSR